MMSKREMTTDMFNLPIRIGSDVEYRGEQYKVAHINYHNPERPSLVLRKELDGIYHDSVMLVGDESLRQAKLDQIELAKRMRKGGN